MQENVLVALPGVGGAHYLERLIVRREVVVGRRVIDQLALQGLLGR